MFAASPFRSFGKIPEICKKLMQTKNSCLTVIKSSREFKSRRWVAVAVAEAAPTDDDALRDRIEMSKLPW